MKNEDLLKLKIDIQVDDESNLLELACLFDKIEFLELLPQIRKDFDIKELVKLEEFETKAFEEPQVDLTGKREEYEEPTFDERPFISKVQKIINFSKYKNPEYLKNFAKKNDTILAPYDLEEPMDFPQMVDTEINFICLQFQRPPYFRYVIRQAIYCGAVNDNYFQPTHVSVIEKDYISSTIGFFQLPQVAIFITPTTTLTDVKKAFSLTQSLYKTDKKLQYYKPRVEFLGNIKRYREWYWETFKRESTGKPKIQKTILDEWISRNPNYDNITEAEVSKGLKRYIKLLASS